MIEKLKDDDAIGTHVKVWMKLNELIEKVNELENYVDANERRVNNQ